MSDTPRRDRISPRIRHTAEFVLSIQRFGETASLALSDAVGDAYIDNATVACLSELAQRGELRLRDLIERIQRPGPQLVRVVDRLEVLGDLVRRPGPSDGDGRAVIISITPSGIERSQAIERALLSDHEAIEVDIKNCIEHLRRVNGEVTHRDRTDSFAFELACLGAAVGRTMRAISPSGDISEALALFTLVVTEDGTSRPSWIARQVGLTSGGTTKVIDRLENAGCIKRSFGLPGDRRGVAVSLTDAGFELLDQMSLEIAPHARQLLPLFVDIADHLQADSA